MGTAFWGVLQRKLDMALGFTVIMFIVMVMLNAYWIILFFIKRRGDLALINLSAVWCLAVFSFTQFHQIEPWAALVLLPYLLWLTYALYLNMSILWLNREFWSLQRVATEHAHARVFLRPACR
jgi:tryptophan-rich sensory protein